MSCNCDKLISNYWADETECVITLPGIEILCPGLQYIWETDGEVSEGDDGIGPDNRESRALQHRKH